MRHSCPTLRGVQCILAYLFVLMVSGSLFGQKAMETTMKNPDELFEYATGLYARKFYDMALKEQNNFLANYPDDKRVKEIMVMRIDTLRNLGKYDEMAALIREYAKIDPKSKYLEGIYFNAGKELFTNKKHKEAVEFLEKLQGSKDVSLQESAIYILSKCLLELGEKEKSLALVKSLADRPLTNENVNRVYAAYEYADALYLSGHVEEALAYCQRLAKVEGLESQMLETVLYKIGVIYYQLNKRAEAQQAFEAYILRFPEGSNAKTVRKFRIVVVWDRTGGTVEKVLELAWDWQKRYPDAADSDMDEILASRISSVSMRIPMYRRRSGETPPITWFAASRMRGILQTRRRRRLFFLPTIRIRRVSVMS